MALRVTNISVTEESNTNLLQDTGTSGATASVGGKKRWSASVTVNAATADPAVREGDSATLSWAQAGGGTPPTLTGDCVVSKIGPPNINIEDDSVIEYTIEVVGAGAIGIANASGTTINNGTAAVIDIA